MLMISSSSLRKPALEPMIRVWSNGVYIESHGFILECLIMFISESVMEILIILYR